MFAIDINSEGLGSMFGDLVWTMAWLLQNLVYSILSYKDVVAVRQIAAHERSLSCVMTGWSSSQLHHCFLQPSYISTCTCNLIYVVAAVAVEEFGRKAQTSAVYQFCCTPMYCRSFFVCTPNNTIGS